MRRTADEEAGVPDYETIKIEREADGIVFVILNRPDKRNAMSPRLRVSSIRPRDPHK